jgi:hypothetical protein
MFLKHIIAFINLHAYQTAIAISAFGGAIIVGMLAPSGKRRRALKQRRSKVRVLSREGER